MWKSTFKQRVKMISENSLNSDSDKIVKLNKSKSENIEKCFDLPEEEAFILDHVEELVKLINIFFL